MGHSVLVLAVIATMATIASASCPTLQASNGIVPLQNLQPIVLTINQVFNGKNEPNYQWSLDLCNGNAPPPNGLRACGTPGFVEEFQGSSCAKSFSVTSTAWSWNGTAANAVFKDTNGNTVNVGLNCGSAADLAALWPVYASALPGGNTYSWGMQLQSSYACVRAGPTPPTPAPEGPTPQPGTPNPPTPNPPTPPPQPPSPPSPNSGCPTLYLSNGSYLQLENLRPIILPLQQVYQGASTYYLWSLDLCNGTAAVPSGSLKPCAYPGGFLAEYTEGNRTCVESFAYQSLYWSWNGTAVTSSFATSGGDIVNVALFCGPSAALVPLGEAAVSEEGGGAFFLWSISFVTAWACPQW